MWQNRNNHSRSGSASVRFSDRAGGAPVLAAEITPPGDGAQSLRHRRPRGEGSRRGLAVLMCGVDTVLRGQYGRHRSGHLGVVGPLPGSPRELAPFQHRTVRSQEELGAQSVSHGRPAQARQGAFVARISWPVEGGISGRRTLILFGTPVRLGSAPALERPVQRVSAVRAEQQGPGLSVAGVRQ